MADVRARGWPGTTLLIVLLPVMAAALAYSDSLWRWDNVVYDWNIRLWQYPPPNDVVIIAIDEISLTELGRWPWSRAVHARLIERLTVIGTGPIGFDVIFADSAADDTDGDAALIQAVADHGQVIFPVANEELSLRGQLLELLPFPELASVAAGFGHVDVDLDRDGIVRGVFLRAGLGTPHWPSFAQAVLQLQGHTPVAPDTMHRAGAAPAQNDDSPMRWARDQHIRIPFAGAPCPDRPTSAEHTPAIQCSFARASYADVLYERTASWELAGKIILIGFTAADMDVLPTPVSGHAQPMPGVEFHANVLETLRRDIGISDMVRHWRALLAALLAVWPLLLSRWLAPRRMLLATVAGVVLPLLISFLLLRTVHIWFAPLDAIIAVVLGHILWSYLRLQSALRYFNQELKRLDAEPTLQSTLAVPRFDMAMEFLHQILPLQGCVLHNADGVIEQQWGQIPAAISEKPQPGRWIGYGSDYWMAIPSPLGHWFLGVRWSEREGPRESQRIFLDQLVTPYLRLPQRPVRSPVELIESKIDQVQHATRRLREMRAFINNSVGQMAAGFIVTDNVGRVLLANPSAAFYLQGYANRVLIGEPLTEALTPLEFSDSGSWQQNLKTVLLEHQTVNLFARTADGRDLQIDIAPFSDIHYISGIVVNFTDISALKESERRRSEMLGFLSHDLRSPLSSIMALAQLAEYKPENLTSGELTRQIRQRIQSLLELMDDFLQLTRAESGDTIMQIELDLLAPAENALMQVEPQAATRQARLLSDFRLDQAWILGNDSLLERTFVNLLTNAVKYSPEGAVIELGIEQLSDEIHCWVKDNGYGIDAAAVPTLFERFKRIKRAEHQHETGTGLGLAFVKKAVERHYGRIEVDSVVGQGSCFHLYFPVLGEDL